MQLTPVPCCGHGHVLQLYDDEDVLADTVAGFFAAGLRAEQFGIVMATAEHRHRIRAGLDATGFDIAGSERQGRLVFLDVDSILREIVGRDGLNEDRFAEMLAPTFARGAEEGRTVRAGGDLVATLWERGDVGSAMRLEELGNDLGAAYDSLLLCTYPRGLFDDEHAARDFERLSALHTRVLPCGDRTLPAGAGDPLAEPRPPRRRTLGRCAHCGEPVAHDEAYVRLYRRAWHLDCALESEDVSGDRLRSS